MTLALRKKTRRVENDLAALIADVSELRHAVTDVIGRVGPSSLDGARKSASNFAEWVGDSASAAYRDATRRSGRKLRLFNRQLRDQPTTTVVVAFGIGLLLSHLLRSRD